MGPKSGHHWNWDIASIHSGILLIKLEKIGKNCWFLKFNSAEYPSTTCVGFQCAQGHWWVQPYEACDLWHA
jgi:hypothetical protein